MSRPMHIEHEPPSQSSEQAIMVLSSDSDGLVAQVKPFLRVRQVRQRRMISGGSSLCDPKGGDL